MLNNETIHKETPYYMCVLKEYRKKREFTAKDISNYLSEHGYPVAAKTIYGWESGASSPDCRAVFLLCELYGIQDICELSNPEGEQKHTHMILTEKEKELIRNYRKKKSLQPAVDKLML